MLDDALTSLTGEFVLHLDAAQQVKKYNTIYERFKTLWGAIRDAATKAVISRPLLQFNSTTINVGNFQGILGDVAHSTISQALEIDVTQGDLHSLKTYLQRLGIKSNELDELESAIRDDPIPTQKATFGPRVTAWLVTTLARVRPTGRELTVGTISSLVASAIWKFYLHQ